MKYRVKMERITQCEIEVELDEADIATHPDDLTTVAMKRAELQERLHPMDYTFHHKETYAKDADFLGR